MEKDNKYYNVIANIVKSHKKDPGLEEILDEIIDDVYSHSEVILNTVSNESVVDAYLEKVVSTSIITVPKRLGFHNNTNNVRPNLQLPNVDKSLVDRMINSSQEGFSKNVVLEIENNSETNSIDINKSTLSFGDGNNLDNDIEDVSNTDDNSEITDENIIDFSSDNDMSDTFNSLDVTTPEVSLEISSETVQQEVPTDESIVSDMEISNGETNENNIDLSENETITEKEQSEEVFNENLDTNLENIAVNADNDTIDLNQFTEESNSIEELELQDISHADDIEYKTEDNSLSAEYTEIEEDNTDNTIDLSSFSVENNEPQPELDLEVSDIEDNVTLDQVQEFDSNNQESESLFLQDETNDIEEIENSNETSNINTEELEESTGNNELEEIPSEDSLDDVIVENNSDSSSNLELDTNSNVLDDSSVNEDELSLENNINNNDNELNEEPNLDEDLTLDISEDDTLIQDSEDELDSEFMEQTTSSDLLELDSSEGDILEEYAPPINENENKNASEEDFIPTNYSMFSYKPDTEEMNNDIDADSIAKEIVELANKNQKFDIIKIYNLKYKEKETIPKIASELQISESDVIEALNEIIAVL